MLQCMTDWLVSSSRRYTKVSKTTRSLHDIPTKVQSVSKKWSPCFESSTASVKFGIRFKFHNWRFSPFIRQTCDLNM
jgi:hypothetical protein